MPEVEGHRNLRSQSSKVLQAVAAAGTAWMCEVVFGLPPLAIFDSNLVDALAAKKNTMDRSKVTQLSRL